MVQIALPYIFATPLTGYCYIKINQPGKNGKRLTIKTLQKNSADDHDTNETHTDIIFED